MRQMLVHAVARAALVAMCASMLVAAFNPFLLVAVASLAAIDLLVLPGVPSAAHCLRRPPEEP